MNIPILFEDESILVIDKPPGITVNRSETTRGDTLQDWLESSGKIQTNVSSEPVDPNALYDKKSEFLTRTGIVHRIDKETSGVLIVAKTLRAFIALQNQFKERTAKKTYIALVHGNLQPNEGEINVPVGRLPWNRQRFGVVPDGKESRTKFAVQKVTDALGEPVTTVVLYPKTGRTHQLRVHLAYIGHPIVGDAVYSGRKRAAGFRPWSGRLLLHAWRLECIHPSLGNRLAFEAPIPDDMKRIL